MSKAPKATEPNFEDALGRLEAIVEAMEGGELPLEQLLGRYEEGTRLARLCQEKLAAAEQRIIELQPPASETDPVAVPRDDDPTGD